MSALSPPDLLWTPVLHPGKPQGVLRLVNSDLVHSSFIYIRLLKSHIKPLLKEKEFSTTLQVILEGPNLQFSADSGLG